MAMTLREFHNGLRLLLNIDSHELEAAGIPDMPADWTKFTRDPYRYFIRANDDTAEKLWTLMQSRMPGRTAQAVGTVATPVIIDVRRKTTEEHPGGHVIRDATGAIIAICPLTEKILPNGQFSYALEIQAALNATSI